MPSRFNSVEYNFAVRSGSTDCFQFRVTETGEWVAGIGEKNWPTEKDNSFAGRLFNYDQASLFCLLAKQEADGR